MSYHINCKYFINILSLDRVSITTAMKYASVNCMKLYEYCERHNMLSIGIFTLHVAHSKGHGHAHFDFEHLVNLSLLAIKLPN